MLVKYVGDYSSPLGVINGKTYECVGEDDYWYRVIDETDEDYLYPKTDFEIINEDNSSKRVAANRYRK